jgi:ABC-type polysaccharide/polyol phosphate export permease
VTQLQPPRQGVTRAPFLAVEAPRARTGRLAQFRSTLDVLLTLTAADLRVRYGRGPWLVLRWLFDPLAALGVYLVLVVVVLDRPGRAPGLSLACAVVPFQLIMMSVTNAMGAVNLRRPILTNMGFSRSLLPVSSVLTESAAFSASWLLIALMMAIYAVPPTEAVLWLPLVLAVCLTVAVSLAYPATLFGLWYRELKSFGVSFVRVLFFLGPGLVPLSQTSPEAAKYLRLNPLTGLFEAFRDMFLYGRSPEAWQLLFPLACASLLLAVFVPVYRREQREFAKVVE